MNKYLFGVSSRKPKKAELKTLQIIASKNDCEFIAADLPDGFKMWFNTDDYGSASNRATSRAVYEDINLAGLDKYFK